jgi:hypothetical protein
MAKVPEFVAVKLSSDVLKAAREQAEADDRSVSAYLRRIITAAVRKAPVQDETDDRA